MAILDFLIGRGNIDRIEEAGVDFAEAQYDPDQVNPMIMRARELATQGIDDDAIRADLMNAVYTQTPSFTGNIGQGRELAMAGQTDRARASAVGQAETRIGMAESEAQQKGRDMEASALAKRAQLMAQRDAGIAEARMQAEAEAGARKQKLLGTLIGFGSAAVGSGLMEKFRNGDNKIFDDFMRRTSGEGIDIPDTMDASGIINEARESVLGSNLDEIKTREWDWDKYSLQ